MQVHLNTAAKAHLRDALATLSKTAKGKDQRRESLIWARNDVVLALQEIDRLLADIEPQALFGREDVHNSDTT